MSSMWPKRGVIAAIVVTGAMGRVAGCASMGSGGKMMYDPPLVIAQSNAAPLVATPTSGIANDPVDGSSG
jgi:hypothetical protein